jgi:hypothetical protein
LLEQAAEKIEFSGAAPEGAIDHTALAVCLKAYPDTNREFFRSLLVRRPTNFWNNFGTGFQEHNALPSGA